jgi:hypothetical protein
MANLFRTVPTFENPHHLARRFFQDAAIAARLGQRVPLCSTIIAST